jgi:anti-sigma factor RsiW
VTCHEAGRVIQAFVDGEIAMPRRAEVAQHLEVCRRCGLEAHTYREIKAVIRRGGEEPATDSKERLRRFVATLE